ncbi:hypothetical protein FBZ93_11147 [Bradyrhizobium macuxiense]|uniref:Uncharacterized protein n=1 Tax=Bradyrhizobium macuxiense TaxID=1755647 RepID=A0A560LBQ7_9BRAD|nr:hypothetical protein [Bradyrhizobium macuxiense]TWB93008.1 hypothetical protein FBZ93_11147 [Bradyrhizobium macuxiense]
MSVGAPDTGARGLEDVANSDGAMSGGDDAHAAKLRQAFEKALGSIAVQIISDSQQDIDDALNETDEDA